MSAMPVDATLRALARQSQALIDYALDEFLRFDFLDYNILGGRLTGGQVVTYLAREADRLADELLVATGQIVPEPDHVRRWQIAEGGSERPGAVMVDDIQKSSERLRETVASVPDWSALPHEVQEVPAHRLLQLVIHLVDLGRPWNLLDDDDAAAATAALPVVLGHELSSYRMTVTDGETITWTDQGGVIEVSGPARMLLAWATGRTDAFQLPADLPTPTLRVWI